MQSQPPQSPQLQSLQHSRSSPNGIKDYLSIHNQHQHIKKRINMLAQLQQHNKSKLKYHKDNLDKLLNIRQDKNYQYKQMIDRNKKDKQQKIIQKNRNTYRRNQNKNKIRNILEQISQDKISDSKRIRAESKEIAKKINENKQKQYQIKRQLRNKIVKFQNQFKENSMEYIEEKYKDFGRRREKEYGEWKEKKFVENKGIQEASKVELEYLNQHSKTFQEFNTVKKKIKEIVNGRKMKVKEEKKKGNDRKEEEVINEN